MRASLIVLLMATGCAGRMSRHDIAWEIAFDASLAADYTQTVEIVSKGEEMNPMIGAYGERVPPAAYFPAVAVGHMAVARVLPAGWPRLTWQIVTLALQLECVIHNRREGYGW